MLANQLLLFYNSSNRIDTFFLLQPYSETDVELISISADEVKEQSYKKIIKMNGLDAGTLVKGIYISPLLSVTNAKALINLISGNNSNSILWSIEANIEFINHDKSIYNPKISTSAITNDKTISEYYSSYFSSCILCVTYDYGNISPTPIDTLSSMLRVQLDILKNNRYITLFEPNYENCFNSPLTMDNFLSVQSAADRINIKSTMFTRLNNSIALVGDIVPIVSYSSLGRSHDSFVMLLSDQDNNVLVIITSEDIIAKDLKTFQKFISLLIEDKIIKYIPQRIKTDSIYKVEFQTNISTDITTMDSLGQYFVNTSPILLNIVSTFDKNVTILLGRRSMRITMRSNSPDLAIYIVSLFIAYNIVGEFKIDKYSFGKNVNVYWSRICQNSKNNVRKPAKELTIKNDNPNVILFEKTSNGEYLHYNEGSYSCTTSVNGINNHIGFVKKIYELEGKCLPCCFQNSQDDTPLYNKCLNKDEIESSVHNTISPFIVENNKSLSNNRIGFLPDEINRLVNKDNTLEVKDKRLVRTNRYYFLYGNSNNEIISTDEDIISYLTLHSDKVIIVNNKIYFSPSNTKITHVFCVIKEILYPIKLISVNKLNRINIHELDTDIMDIISQLKPQISLSPPTNIRTNQFITINNIPEQDVNFKVVLIKNSIDVIINTIMFNISNSE